MAGNIGKKKILLVDDSEIQPETEEQMLKNEYEITTARTGKEALEHFTRGLVPNLIILDLFMPGMDGWETFGRIKAISLLHEVPIIFLSSKNEKSIIDRANTMGAAGFITKPYDVLDLLDRIEKVLEIQQ